MAPELAQWITPAVVVAVLLYMHRSIRRDMTQMETRLRQDMKQMESRLESRFDSRMDRMESRLREDMERLDRRVARLEHGQAKLEGLLEGLREAITRQPAA